MNIFLSYAAEDRLVAEEICYAIRASGHSVFFDRDALPAGGDYNSRIRQEIEQSDAFVFLVSPHSTEKRGYALTELKFARGKWPSPVGRVLPVMVAPTDYREIDRYLASVTVLEPVGSAAAETVAALGPILKDAAAASPAPNEKLSVPIERLSSEKLDERLGAIRALALLAKESARYHSDILAGLAAFVRERSAWKPDVVRTGVGEDVQAALTLIGRVPKKDEWGNLYRTDLHNIDISGSNLENSNLEGAVLWGSNLRSVVLARANLREADLGGVDFTEASLEMANLEGAFLWRSAPLEPKRPCILSRARLGGAKLTGAHLEAAILVDAVDLDRVELRKAIVNQETLLPWGMGKNE
jgi:hypothetical protein